MRVYEIKEPPLPRPTHFPRGPLAPSEDSAVDGTHQWRLPAAVCPICKDTLTTELAYPALQLPESAKSSMYRLRKPISWEEYEQLKKPLQDLIPAGFSILPGTDFGQFVGVTIGPYADFGWILNHTCLVRRDVFNALNQILNHQLIGVSCRLKSQRKIQPDYMELEALPYIRLAEECEVKFRHWECPKCYMYRLTSLDDNAVKLKRSSIPSFVHIFRVLNFRNSWELLCSEAFHKAVLQLGLKKISFEPYGTVVNE